MYSFLPETTCLPLPRSACYHRAVTHNEQALLPVVPQPIPMKDLLPGRLAGWGSEAGRPARGVQQQ